MLTKEKLLERMRGIEDVEGCRLWHCEFPREDWALARKQAEKSAPPYQTYIKSLLHETLADRERGERRLGRGCGDQSGDGENIFRRWRGLEQALSGGQHKF